MFINLRKFTCIMTPCAISSYACRRKAVQHTYLPTVPILEGQSLFLVHCPTFSLLKIRFVPINVTFLCNFFLTNLVILAIFAKFLSNVPLSGQKSHFFKDFVPLSGFDRLASMSTCMHTHIIAQIKGLV